METKPWYKSRILWANLLAVIGIGVHLLTGEVSQEQAMAEAGVAVLGVINFFLRLRTNKAIE